MNIFPVLLALVFATSLTAQQVTLKTPDMNVEPGENLHLDIQVEDFDQITGVQFSVNWDENVLQFIGVDNFGLPDMTTEGNFGTLEVSGGKLRFSWYQLEQTGVSVSDMSTLFSIWFKAIGTDNTSSPVTITNDPIVIEVVDVGSQMLPVNVVTGTVYVGGQSADFEVKTSDFTLFQNSPNPFTDLTYIHFTLNNSTQAHLSIYDNAGRIVYEQTGIFSNGPHTIPIRRDMFQSAGTYLFSLKTAGATATRQLIVQ